MSPRAVAQVIISSLILPLASADPPALTPPTTRPSTQPIRRAATLPVGAPARDTESAMTCTATQKHGQVTVAVRGYNPTAGYETKLVQSRATAAGAPEFIL